MSGTLVIQSHQTPLPYSWIQACLDSVSNWSDSNGYDYQKLGDELFDSLPEGILEKTHQQKVVATDLARLLVLRNYLDRGYERVVWLDADFLLFDPAGFQLPEESYAVGREVWVQVDRNGKLKTYKKVHNAFLMFCRGNSFLDFYADTAARLLRQNHGTMPPQFIGPKLLTAIHNVAVMPVMEAAGMFSPPVIRDLLRGEGRALDLFQKKSPAPVSGANLCTSSVDRQEVTAIDMENAVDILVAMARPL